MGFISIWFLLFLPLAILGHQLTPQKYKWLLLLVASYFFYGFYEPFLLVIILSITLVAYVFGLLLNQGRKKIVLLAGVLITLSFLLYFKYFDFFINFLNDLYEFTGENRPFSVKNIILPIGISFYTFQALSYLIDVYRKKNEAEKHLGYLALFIAFFPQLVAGPIEKSSHLIPQLKTTQNLNWNNFSEGSKLILLGYFKKIVIADTLFNIVQHFYANQFDSSSSIEFWMISITFIYYVYADFSGYCDIAMGIAKYFGIELTPNFNKPFSSLNMRELWRRWHISLYAWIKTYLYDSLHPNRRISQLHFMSIIMLIFLIMGLWHGASYNFVAFGFFAGLFNIIDYKTLNIRHNIFKKIHLNVRSTFGKFLFRFTVVNLFAFIGIFSITENIQTSFLGISKVLDFTINYRLGIPVIITIITCIAVLEGINFYTPKNLSHPFNSLKSNSLRIITYSLVFTLISLFYFNNVSTFYYFQF